jgi:crotonobetainyl-CoA:carnitine CoA-transferase CaiB-like acyl-CoA transferase
VAPELGEHTRDVLHEAGLSDAEVDALVSDGVVGVA